MIKQKLSALIENWPIKILCLGLAVLLSFFYRLSLIEDRFFSVPLDVYVGDSFAVASPIPRMVRVHLRGDTESVYSVQESDVEAYVDLSSYESEGEYRAPVRVRAAGAGEYSGAVEISADTSEITVALETRVTKTVPIVANFKGETKSGFDFINCELDPPEIEISGPRSMIEKTVNCMTEPIDLTDRDADFSDVANILNNGVFVRLTGGDKTRYSVSIGETMLTRTFDSVKLSIVGLDERFTGSLSVRSISLRLRGPQRRLGDYVPSDSTAYVFCGDVESPGVYSLPITVAAPSFAEVLSLTPREALLTADAAIEDGGGGIDGEIEDVINVIGDPPSDEESGSGEA